MRLQHLLESAELAEKPNQKTIRLLPFCTSGTIRLCFCFLVFSFRGAICALLFFGAKSLLLSCASLRVTCYHFGLNMHFLLFFRAGDLQFCEARRLGLVRPQDPSWCPVTPSFGEPPTAGRQRVFSWVANLLSSSHTWETRMWSVSSRLSPPVPGPHGGVTPAVHLGLLRWQPVRSNP